MKKKILVSILALTMVCMSLAGCGTSNTKEGVAETEQNAETLVESAVSEEQDGETVLYFGACNPWDTLAPFAPNTMQQMYLNSCYQYLAVYDKFGGELQGALLKNWEQTDDYTYEMELYDYIYDVDGNPFTASDVVFCFETAMASNNFSKLNYVESIVANDDYHVTLVLNTSAVGVFAEVVQTVNMVTQAAYEASADDMATTPVGTTQYKVTSCTTGSQLKLEKVDNYWQTDESLIPDMYKANADQIIYDVVTEESQIQVALENGEIQMAWQTPSNIAIEFMGSEDFSVYQIPNTLCHALMFNCTSGSVFADNLSLRQAVATAIDNQALIDVAVAGQGTVAKTFGASNYGGYNTDWDAEEYYDYDADRAAELLAEAGYREGELSIRLMSSSSSAQKACAEIIQSNLSAIGINVEILSYDTATYTSYKDASSGEYDICLIDPTCSGEIISAWSSYLDANLSTSGATMYGVYDADFQKLVEETNTPAGYTQENVNSIHQYLKDNCYIYGTYSDYKFCVYQNDIASVYVAYVNGNGHVVPGASTYN